MFDKVITKFLRTVSFIMFVTMIIVVFIQVMLRYFFEAPLAWSDELARLLLVWTSFLGVTLIHFSDAGHPAVTFIADKIPERPRKVMDIVLNIGLTFCFLVVLKAGIEYTAANTSFVSPVLHYPNALKYIVFPICIFLMILKNIQRIIRDAKEIMTGKKGA